MDRIDVDPRPSTIYQRRSKDGFVSATGMFKIAFPWAKLDEERSEREYLKTRTETSEDEIAGNVWISPLLGKRNGLSATSGCCSDLRLSP